MKIGDCDICQHAEKEICSKCTSFADKWELSYIYAAAPELYETIKATIEALRDVLRRGEEIRSDTIKLHDRLMDVLIKTNLA